jgi:hypothetical protein
MPLAVAFYSRTVAIAFAEKEVCHSAKLLHAHIARILNIKMNTPATAIASASRAPRALEFAPPVGFVSGRRSGVMVLRIAMKTKRIASNPLRQVLN